MAAAETGAIFFNGEGFAALITSVLAVFGAGVAWGRAEYLTRAANTTAEQAEALAKKTAESLAEKYEKRLREMDEQRERETRERIAAVQTLTNSMHIQGAATNEAISMFRIEVATDYINREVMRDVEARLSADIDRISANVENISADIKDNNREIKESVDKLADRLNRVLDQREARGRQT